MIQRVRKIGLFLSLVLLGHILCPLLFISQLLQTPHNNIIAWALSLYKAGSYVGLLYIIGAWGWFGSLARLSFPVLLALAAFFSYPSEHAGIVFSALVAPDPIISLCVGSFFVLMTIQALLGRRLHVPALELSFPFSEGSFIIAQGGTTSIVNHHAVSPSQRYALDVLKLNAIGIRARGFYPADPKRYAIFGSEVVSPCNGVVAAAEDRFVDFSPPERDREHRAGNYVAIECKGSTVYLAHFMQGTVCVKPGERVHVGQALGRVGNSGNTTEPHLHIHAEEGYYPGQFSGNRGIPIRFNGRFLVRNDRIAVPPQD